jgi:class 3 adenylate cyclase
LPAASEPTAHRVKAVTTLAGLVYWQGDYDAAGEAYRETLALCEGLGDLAGKASAQFNLGWTVTIGGDLDEAWSLLSEARKAHTELGDRGAYARDGVALGLVAEFKREWSKARQILEESISILRELGDRWWLGQALIAIGRSYREDPGYEREEETYREAVAIFRETMDLSGLTQAMAATGALRILQGRPELGLKIASAGRAFEEKMGGGAPEALRPWGEARDLAADKLDADAIARAWSEGQSLSIDEAVALMLEEVGGAEPVPRVSRTLMFTDIVGSTSLLEVIGDERWQQLRAWHDRTLRELFSQHHGEEIDHAGDGFFVVFPEAADALRCAVQIQHRLDEHRAAHGFAPEVRIGIHTAEASLTKDGYAGLAVHQAARIAATARGGEILVSEESLQAAGRPQGWRAREPVALRGLREPVKVWSFDPQKAQE